MPENHASDTECHRTGTPPISGCALARVYPSRTGDSFTGANMSLNAYALRKWSVRVRWRDRRCQLCGARSRLQAHHLNSKSYFPEEAYDIDNGVALCGAGSRCHSAFHNKYKGGTRKKCTRKDWTDFVELFTWANAITVQTNDE